LPVSVKACWVYSVYPNGIKNIQKKGFLSMNSNQEYRSGFIAVMGRPNVGKSTLLNRLLNQKIAAVSPKPQTTRLQQFGILSLPDAQLIFIDTPGLHHPQHKLGEFMNQDARLALKDADTALVVFDVSFPPSEEDHLFGEVIKEVKNQPTVFLALNKTDKVTPAQLKEHKDRYQALLPEAELIPVSAITGDNIDLLLAALKDSLPEGPQLYPEDQITDLYERDIAADMIRAASMLHLQRELPHVIAVRIDEYNERGNHGAYIEATIFVERDSQKGIIIGGGGRMIKRIGSTARKEIEAMSGRKVFLKLRVKVKKNWRNDINALRLFGFKK
jgi:GTP-binding protein Era